MLASVDDPPRATCGASRVRSALRPAPRRWTRRPDVAQLAPLLQQHVKWGAEEVRRKLLPLLIEFDIRAGPAPSPQLGALGGWVSVKGGLACGMWEQPQRGPEQTRNETRCKCLLPLRTLNKQKSVEYRKATAMKCLLQWTMRHVPSTPFPPLCLATYLVWSPRPPPLPHQNAAAQAFSLCPPRCTRLPATAPARCRRGAT